MVADLVADRPRSGAPSSGASARGSRGGGHNIVRPMKMPLAGPVGPVRSFLIDGRMVDAMTFSLPLQQIDSALLETLKADVVREGPQLDYKEALPGSTDDAKKDFLADVTAFANAAGGDLIYGVRERRDSDNRPTGEIDAIVGLPDVNMDAQQLRLGNIIRDGVSPRMAVNFHVIPRGSDPPCLLVRVPRTWSGLHMIIFGNWSRFYARTSAGNRQLDAQEIRTGFLAADTAHERVRRFRAERVTQVLALETPVPTIEGPKLILHALPFNSGDEVWARFITTTDDTSRLNTLPTLGGAANSWRFNVDGFVTYTMQQDRTRQSYTQLFRSGGIEALSGAVLIWDRTRKGFYGWGLEDRVIQAFNRYQQLWRTLEVTPPLLVGLTLSGVRGWRVLAGDYSWGDDQDGFDRDIVMLPETTVLDFGIPADVLLRPLFDIVWNGGGWPRSPNYKDDRWSRPR